MTARKINDKNADMDYHAVPPPDYNAGGDFKREELCQKDPQTFTMEATGASSSSGRLAATGASSSSGRRGAVNDPLNTGGSESLSWDELWRRTAHQEIRWSSKNLSASESGGTGVLREGTAQHLCKHVGKTPQTSAISQSI